MVPVDLDRHQPIARPAGALFALALEPHLGAVFDTLGQLEIDGLAIRQRDPLILRAGGIDEGTRRR